VIYTGGRISIMSTNERGIVIDYDRVSSTCKVIMESNLTKAVEYDAEKLKPIPEVILYMARHFLTM
jgi:hypothetical protein